MRATELIGKLATRKEPATYGNGVKDYSYMGEMVLIVNADEYSIAIVSEPYLNSSYIHTLNKYWCDDNWVERNEFMDKAKANFNAFKKETTTTTTSTYGRILK